jgi:hypothetical protein
MSQKTSMKIVFLAASAVLIILPHAFAQKPCSGAKDMPLVGAVRDNTLALIPRATVTLDLTQTAISTSDGQFRFDCVLPGRHTLSVRAPGFSEETVSVKIPHSTQISVVLQLETVVTDVLVNAGDGSATDGSATSVGPNQTISGNRLQALADDPDDLLRELQQLAAAAGGDPSNTSIVVDGFQGSGNTITLPPKSSIAYIKIDPDLFSAEYNESPYDGGRIEIYTKPGQSTFHGGFFATNGSPWMNARDPFSVSRAAVGKQLYGFELSGPIRKKDSDFTASLEHRSIDNFAFVNAVTSIDANGNPIHTVASIPAPQELWAGLLRVDWQLGSRNTFYCQLCGKSKSSGKHGRRRALTR